MSTERAPRRLWRELFRRLLMPMLAIVAATAALGALTAHRLADRVYDRWLIDAARSVAALVRFDAQGRGSVDLPPVAESVLLFDDTDVTHFSVAQAGRLLAGRSGIAEHGANEVAHRRGSTFRAELDGQPVQVARVDVTPAAGPPVTVLVAETLLKRERSAQELMAVLWPLAALVVGAALTVALAVQRSVKPLEAVAARWNEQSHLSLQPIVDHRVPLELLPFTTALNGLLARIREMLARERLFAATAAHQLRTALMGLQLGLARAQAAASLEESREIVRGLNGASQRTARLVQQLLAIARLDPEQRGDLDMTATDLVSLVQDVGTTHAEQAIAKDIELDLTEPGRPVSVRGNADLLAEALGNLLDNAIRYTPRGGHVHVEVLDAPPRLRVSDSGAGIAPQDRERVFERFVRGRDTAADGTGLGLSIVRDIASLHGARVGLEDSPLGGISATIEFPPAALG